MLSELLLQFLGCQTQWGPVVLRGHRLFQKRVFLFLEHHILFLEFLFYFCEQNFYFRTLSYFPSTLETRVLHACCIREVLFIIGLPQLAIQFFRCTIFSNKCYYR